MKKKAVLFIALLAAMAVLLAVYASVKNSGKSGAAEPEPEVMTSGKYKLVELAPEDIDSIFVDNGKNGGFYMDVTDDGIIVKDGENMPVDMSLLDDEKTLLELRSLINISSDNEVEKTEGGVIPDKYGLDEEKAAAKVYYHLKDGSEQQLYLGVITPDEKYYYAAVSLTEVYTIGKTTGDNILKSVEELADLDMEKLDPNALAMLEIVQEGREDLRISFEKENENSNDSLNKNGLQTLVMHDPIPDLLVYPYNLETGLLYNYENFTIEKMVEIGDKNFAEYGLDKPVMSIAMADTEASVTLKVGKETEDGKGYYVTPYGNKAVYTMTKTALEPFFDYNIIDFIQKFVALHYRYELSDIDIKSDYGDYTVEFKEENGKTLTEENGTPIDKRQEYINGKAVDSEAFVDYYELLVGLTFDALEDVRPQGEPHTVITYHLLDGTEDKVSFYDYDENFFVAVKDGSEGALNMLITKQQVKQALDRAAEL